MKLSFCTIGFQRNKWGKDLVIEVPVSTILPRLAANGYDGVELWWGHVQGLSAAELRDLDRQLRDLGLTVAMISPYFNFTSSAETAAESMAAARQAVAIARQVGGRGIRCFTGKTASKDATPDQWERTVQCLQILADETRADGIHWCFETHSWNLMDTIESSRKLVERIARDNVKLILQPSTFAGDYLAATESLAPMARHVHATNHRPEKNEACALADGQMSWPRIMEQLRQAGFDDFISVEWFGADPEAAVVREAQYLRSLIGAGA